MSRAARDWLGRNVEQVLTILETRQWETEDLVTKEEIKTRVDRVLQIRADRLEREVALKLARHERRR